MLSGRDCAPEDRHAVRVLDRVGSWSGHRKRVCRGGDRRVEGAAITRTMATGKNPALVPSALTYVKEHGSAKAYHDGGLCFLTAWAGPGAASVVSHPDTGTPLLSRKKSRSVNLAT
jgi:hypothetical protein